MSKRVIIGELAGFAWLCADAAWALGDRLHWDNTRLVAVLFGTAMVFGLWFIYAQIREAKG